MISATPDLRLPSQSQDIITLWPRPIYTAWWQRHMCVNNLPKVVAWKRNGRESNCDPLCRESSIITITPPGHAVICCEICSPDLRPFFIHRLTMLLSLRRLPRCHYPHDTIRSCDTDERICCVSRYDFGDLNNAFMIEVFVDHGELLFIHFVFLWPPYVIGGHYIFAL